MSVASSLNTKVPNVGNVSEHGAISRTIRFNVKGMSCGVCAAAVEKSARSIEGVDLANVDLTGEKLLVQGAVGKLNIDRILKQVQRAGYQLTLADDTGANHEKARSERRSDLTRIAVAGLLGMQVMMLATALYFADPASMDQGLRTMLTWLCMLLTTPILFYCALPFLRGALRSIQNLNLGMDVTVSLGLILAYAGSVWNTFAGSGELYFESVAMFTFLLLLARFFERDMLRKNLVRVESLSEDLPELVDRIKQDGVTECVAIEQVKHGDKLLVAPGNVIGADGVIEGSTTTVDESLLTGESEPVIRADGELVHAGSINLEKPIVVVVSEAGEGTHFSHIRELAEKSLSGKSKREIMADKVASWVIPAVLLSAALVGIYWFNSGSERWLSITISVLVVTCPCALSLATPTAVAATVHALSGRGLVTLRADVLEQLVSIRRAVFDKTGTLTDANLNIHNIQTFTDKSESEVLNIAAALEQNAFHPIALAIRSQNDGDRLPHMSSVQVTAGEGVSGEWDTQNWHLGSSKYIESKTGLNPPKVLDFTHAILANQSEIVAIFEFTALVKADAAQTILDLTAMGIDTTMLSGDQSNAVQEVAKEVGILDWESGLSPDQKLSRVQHYQSQGEQVLMVGDGLNDAPVIAAADASIAVSNGAALSRTKADLVLFNSKIRTITTAIQRAKQTQDIIKQNLGWAIIYNIIALPAAAMGLVPPWLAAIGMSISSLIVVGNSLRLARFSSAEK